MEISKSRMLAMLVDLMTLVPAHRRHEVRDHCAWSLSLVGEKIEDHEYLFTTRPRKQALAVRGAQLTPAIGSRKYSFSLAIHDENSGSETLVSGMTSLHEVAKFAGRGVKTIEMWVRDPRRTQEGVTEISHNYLPGPDHVMFFKLYEGDWRLEAERPGLFDAVELAKQLPRFKRVKRF